MTKKEDDELFQRLETEGNERGISSSLLEFYKSLLSIQSRTEKSIGKVGPGLSKKVAHSRLDQGLPLLSYSELSIDWPLLKNTFAEVVAAFAAYPDLFGEIPTTLKKPDSDKPSLPRKAVKAWFEGAGLPSVITLDDERGYPLLESVIQATLKPFLVSQSKALLPLVNQESWRRGYCPVCGGGPDFAFLDTESGARWLVCSRCDSEWVFQRLECPYCGSTDQESLSYFTDDKGLYRLYVCEKCKNYLKAIDKRQAKAGVFFPLERLLSLNIDAQAREYGYGTTGDSG